VRCFVVAGNTSARTTELASRKLCSQAIFNVGRF